MSSVIVQRRATNAVPVLEPAAFRADVLDRERAGSRLLNLYGARQDEYVLVSAVFRDPAGAVDLTRTWAPRHAGYRELTSDLPAAHGFERELHEQTGLAFPGHPWLKPVRFQGQEQAAMDAYPFYKLEGKEVHEVAVGPIHAGVIEPGSFRFMCHGEQVHHLEIHLGYQHRGVEARLLEGDPLRLTALVETIAGDTSVAHAWAYCAALESLADCELPLETEVARAIALELERVAMHLATLAGLAADVGFLQGATSYGRLRTTAINTTMRLCGSRFGRGALRPGGIGMQLTPDLLRDLTANLELLRTDLPIIDDCFFSSRTVRQRLEGVGVLTRPQALALGVVGLAARASGVPIDARQQTAAGAYHALPIAPCLLEAGDCWARARLRMLELGASLTWLKEMLAQYGHWQAPRKLLTGLGSEQIAVALVEGFRGEVVHCLETNAEGRLRRYKVLDPSFRNWLGLALAVRQNEISDFPICNKSFDLSYAGHDL
jgi:Ni,Fe-hydrogenase III large subunit